MSDRVEPYYRQQVTHGEVEQWHDHFEAADQAIVDEHEMWGIVEGLIATESGPPDFKVRVSEGFAYDENGQRIVQSGGPDDYELTSYIPTNPGEERYVAIYYEDADDTSDARVDGNGVPLNYLKEESHGYHIEAGTVGAPAQPKPAIVPDKVLICVVHLTNGMASITNADISMEWYGLDAASVDRQVGGVVAPGRLLEEDKRIAYDSAIGDTVITIGNTNTLDADGGDISMGGGVIDTEGGNILVGAGLVDTEGGDVDFGGGDADLETGNVIHATHVDADEADPANTKGHLYADPATGTLIEIRKPWDIPRESFVPTSQPTDPWTAAGNDNEWAINSTTRVSWQMFWNGAGFGAPRTGRKINAPIFVPNGSRLVRVTLEITNLVALPNNLEFKCGVAYSAKNGGGLTTVVTKTYDNTSGGIWTAGGTGTVIAMATTDAPVDIVLGDGYTTAGNTYFVFAYMDDLAGVGNNNYVSIIGGTANVLIREASHVF
jgi:hypothetical protein